MEEINTIRANQHNGKGHTSVNDVLEKHKNSISKIVESAKSIATALYKDKHNNKIKNFEKLLKKLDWFKAREQNNYKLAKIGAKVKIQYVTKKNNSSDVTQETTEVTLPEYDIESVIKLTKDLSAFCNREENGISELIKTNGQNSKSILAEYTNIIDEISNIWKHVNMDQKKTMPEWSLKLFLSNQSFNNFYQKINDVVAITNYLKILSGLIPCCFSNHVTYMTEQQKSELLKILEWKNIKESVWLNKECLAPYLRLLLFTVTSPFFENSNLLTFKEKELKDQYQEFWKNNLGQVLDNKILSESISASASNKCDSDDILKHYLMILSNITYMIDLFDVKFRDCLTETLTELTVKLLSGDCIKNVFQDKIWDLSNSPDSPILLVMIIINMGRCMHLFSEKQQIEIMKFYKILLDYKCFRLVLLNESEIIYSYFNNLKMQLNLEVINKSLVDELFTNIFGILKQITDDKDFRSHIFSLESNASDEKIGSTVEVVEVFARILNNMSSLTASNMVSKENTEKFISYVKEIINSQNNSDIKDVIVNTEAFPLIILLNLRLRTSISESTEIDLFKTCIPGINRLAQKLKNNVSYESFSFSIFALKTIINKQNVFRDRAFDTKCKGYRKEIDMFTEILKNLACLATKNLDSKTEEFSLYNDCKSKFIEVMIGILCDKENDDIKTTILNNRDDSGAHKSILNLLFIFGNLLSENNLPTLNNEIRNKLIDSFFSLIEYRKTIFLSDDAKPTGTISFYVNTLYKLVQFYSTEQKKTIKHNTSIIEKFFHETKQTNALDKWISCINTFISYLDETIFKHKKKELCDKLGPYIYNKISFIRNFISNNETKIRTSNSVNNIFGTTKYKTRNNGSGLKLNLSGVSNKKNKFVPVSNCNIKTINNKSGLKLNQQFRSMNNIFGIKNDLRLFSSSNKLIQLKSKDINSINFNTNKLKLNTNQKSIMPNMENKNKLSLGNNFNDK